MDIDTVVLFANWLSLHSPDRERRVRAQQFSTAVATLDFADPTWRARAEELCASMTFAAADAAAHLPPLDTHHAERVVFSYLQGAFH